MPATIGAKEIKETVAAAFGVSIAAIDGDNRCRWAARPRMVAMALTRECTNMALPRIGLCFNRDHTTVLHAVRRVPKLAEQDEALRGLIDEIRRAVENDIMVWRRRFFLEKAAAAAVGCFLYEVGRWQ